MFGGYGGLLVASLLTLLLIGVIAWIALRFGLKWLNGARTRATASSEDGVIRLLARASIDAQCGLYVISAGGKTLLLATGTQGVQLLTELDDEVVAHELEMYKRTARRPFRDYLRAAFARRYVSETTLVRRSSDADAVDSATDGSH